MLSLHAALPIVVAASSHWFTGLTFALDPSGEPLIKNRRITCINEIEVAAAGLDKVLPLLPEKMVRKMRGLYSAGAPETEHVVVDPRSEEHTSELQSLMRISYAVFCLKKKKNNNHNMYTQFIQIISFTYNAQTITV